MPQRLDGPAVKFPADEGPDGGGEDQQKQVLAGEAIHEKHAEDHNRQCQRDPQYEQVALTGNLSLFASALLVLPQGAAQWSGGGAAHSALSAFLDLFFRPFGPRGAILSLSLHFFVLLLHYRYGWVAVVSPSLASLIDY